jgi:hypothetical protein
VGSCHFVPSRSGTEGNARSATIMACCAPTSSVVD